MLREICTQQGDTFQSRYCVACVDFPWCCLSVIPTRRRVRTPDAIKQLNACKMTASWLTYGSAEIFAYAFEYCVLNVGRKVEVQR